jgi:hypothetical protein
MDARKKKSAAMNTVFGILLVLFSIYIIISSLSMKYFKSFIDGAGFFPLIIGCVLIGLGAVLTFIGINAGGFAELKEVLTGSFIMAFIRNEDTVRVLILLSMMVVYVFILLGNIPFVWATTIYLFFTFVYLKAYKKTWIIPGWLMSLITAIITSFVIFYAFKLGLGLTIL